MARIRIVLLILALAWGTQMNPTVQAGDSTPASEDPGPWVLLEPGLHLGTFVAPQASVAGDSLIRVLRINPKFFQFRLLNASATDGHKRLSARDWAKKHSLVAAINASMYQKDSLTSVSLMKTVDHINNTWYSKDRALLAFDALDPKLPEVQILDRDCQDVESLRTRYQTLVQSIRMVDCKGNNVWKPQDKIWSTAAIGMDQNGNILFMHVRSPYSTHDLIQHLKALPIGLKRAMYVEGGAEAQMAIHVGKTEMQFLGSYSSGSNENDSNQIAWPIPNVIGIVRVPSTSHETPQ